MRVKYNHTAYCYPHKHTEIVTPTSYWTFLSPLKEHYAALWGHFKQVLKFPNGLEPQSDFMGSLFPCTQWCSSFPFRGHMVSHTQCVSPLMALFPVLSQGLSRDVVCRNAGLGSLLPPWCSRAEGRKGRKISENCPCEAHQDGFSMAETRAVDKASVLFLGQAAQSDIDLCLQCSESTSSLALASWRTGT